MRKVEARAMLYNAPVFAALGDETRLRLVARLGDEGPLSITKLTAGTEMTRQAVSKHLRVLERAGILSGRREGREQLWVLDRTRLGEARACLDSISAHWDKALGRLRLLVEAEAVEEKGK